jgi:hypothetical protein
VVFTALLELNLAKKPMTDDEAVRRPSSDVDDQIIEAA